MEKLFVDFNHWWGYLFMLYYLTWLITYQILLYKNMREKDGVLITLWRYIRSAFLRNIVYTKVETTGHIFLIILMSIWLIICGFSWIICWIFSVLIGFVPLLNNVVSSFKILNNKEGKHCYEFEDVKYYETFLIRVWIRFFVFIGKIFYKLLTIKIRKQVTE
ncbi:MAG: hypothetical protein WCL02_01585 [bacterium]